MEDRYLSRQGSGVWRSLRDGDFEEEDVWDVIRDGKKIKHHDCIWRESNKDFQNRSWHNDCDDADDDEVGNGGDEDEEEEEDDYDSREPPHEFIARKLARSQISSFSVFEGAGRTLKGRDLSKVRNAVLSKTGFLESL
ncbi:hypothetical protein M0R45_015278 [Rubus argutus]|uniref:Senescence regulator S40 n=1 Tax=Rubus argutus TaxID=59490 RepID=A0AAW1XR88_RUBAR